MSSSRVALALATALSATLVALYVALGGASYTATPVADPCVPRTWRTPEGVEKTIEQIALSTADGVACELGVSREELVLALTSDEDLDAFADRRGISRDDAEDAVRKGLLRALGDAQRAGAIGGTLAGVLRGAAERFPMSVLLAVLRGGSALLPG